MTLDSTNVKVTKEIPNGSYLSKHGYVIKKDSIDNDEIQLLKTELRARPLQDEKYGQFNKIDNSYPIYTETKNKLYIPKMYGIKRYGNPNKCLPNYKGKEWDDCDLKFDGELYENQIEPVNALISACHNIGGGILNMGTGLGKTLMTINAISKLKIKTIIVVNKISLMHQWESELKKFIPGIEIGFLQGQKKIDVEGKHVVIAMLQSLARVNYTDSLFEDIGLTVIDEIHNTPSRGFSKVLAKLSSQYTIGLSATPKRGDGCEYVFQYHIGDIVYKSSAKRNGKPPILNMIRIDSSDYKEITSINKISGQSQIQFTSMLSELIQMPKRNRLILEIIKHLVTTENRKILVLSDRREHLKSLKKILDSDLNSSFTYGLFLGQMKQSDLERTRASQVILATFSAFGEGVSEKDLDTLILITPKKFVGHLKNSIKNESGRLEQIVGRIFRKTHTEKNPMIIDFHDNFSVYKTQSAQRKTFYKIHFKTSITENNKVNLDDYNIEEISMDSIKCTKKIQNNIEKDNQQGVPINNCIIQD